MRTFQMDAATVLCHNGNCIWCQQTEAGMSGYSARTTLVTEMASRSVAVLNSITGVPSYTLAGNHFIELFRSVDQFKLN